MGVVYKARQVKLKRIVALKMIRSGALANRLDVQRFEVEAKAAAKLSHPGIVSVHEVGIHDGRHFYTMDFVEGGNLCQLHREKPVPAKYAVKLVRQLAESMHYAHLKGIVHRDLKPANILLTASGEPRIADFGLAKRVRDDDESHSPTMTETGQILGTAGYMSPEQASGKSRLVGPSSDVYSLGAVLYALLTSRAPFVGETPSHTIMQVLQNEPISPRKINPSIPRDIETICLKCLEKEPHKRYGTAQLLADDLQRFLEGRPVVARPISRPARVWRWCRRNPLVSALSTAMLLTLLLGSVVSTAFGVIAGERRDEAIVARNNESDAKQHAQKDRDAAEQARKQAQAKERDALQNLYIARLYTLVPTFRQGEWGELDRMMAEWTPRTDEPDFRGWEWYYLKDQVNQRLTVLPGKITHAVWSHDGKQLLTVGERIQVLNAQTFEITHELSSEPSYFGAWSRDNSHIAAVMATGETRVFNLLQPAEVHNLPLRDFVTSNLTWSPDGSQLAIVGRTANSAEVQLWQLDGLGPIGSLPLGDSAHLWSIDWHPRDSRVVVSYKDRFAVWDTSTGERLVDAEAGSPSWTVAWNPLGNTFLATGAWNTRIWTEHGKVALNAPPAIRHSFHAEAACWNSDGSYLATGGRDAQILIWRAEDFQCVGREVVCSTRV
ncbi:MAG: serine/threonine-protein kinase, partial [Aureliella sp.]